MPGNHFHDTHYGLFHVAIPRFLRGDALEGFVEAAQSGDGGAILAEIWDVVARQVTGIGADGRLHGEVAMRTQDFSVSVSKASPGLTLLVMTGPQVREPLEVACAVAGFREQSPADSLRYFTCEAPTAADRPWTVGEWLVDGSRRNLGPIENPSVNLLRDFATRLMRAEQYQGGADIQTRAVIREIPDVEELLGGSGGPGGRKPEAAAMGANPLRGAGDFPRVADVGPSGGDSVAPAGSAGAPIPSVGGPVAFAVSWSSAPDELASAALTNLYRINTSGGKALVMSAKKTKGLAKKTSSYVQFMWNDDDSLLVEVQGDYSYWGLSVPSDRWPYLESRGLTIPTGGVGNFGLRIQAGARHEQRLEVLAGVFEAFQVVLQPQGKVVESHF